jgi:hypothetical protein
MVTEHAWSARILRLYDSSDSDTHEDIEHHRVNFAKE